MFRQRLKDTCEIFDCLTDEQNHFLWKLIVNKFRKIKL